MDFFFYQHDKCVRNKRIINRGEKKYKCNLYYFLVVKNHATVLLNGFLGNKWFNSGEKREIWLYDSSKRVRAGYQDASVKP